MTTIHLCGGSILNEQWIITASHCFVRSQIPADYVVRVGDYNHDRLDPDEQELKVSRIILHPSFTVSRKGVYDYDIALIQVAATNGHGIRFSHNVQSIYLPNQRTNVHSLRDCYISGWGVTSNAVNIGSRILQVAKISVLNAEGQRECNDKFNNYVTDQMLCAGNVHGSGVDSCTGDSGGPLVCKIRGRDVLVGITSWGTTTCATPGYPGVYTDVQKFLEWIRNPI